MKKKNEETSKIENIDFINIGGKDRPVFYNQMTLEVFLKYIRMEGGKILPSSLIYASLYAPLYTGAYVTGPGSRDFDFKQVCMWADELYDLGKEDEMKKVCDTWAESKPFKKWLYDLNKTEKKKDKEQIKK